MASFDDLLDHATHKLKLDPELHREVRRELAAHLEDAVSEYRAAGYDDEHACQEASKALGDADALADQLWQANRSRIHLRYWLKWLGRISVVPLLVLAAITLLLPMLISQGQMRSLTNYGFSSGQWYEQRLESQLSEDVLFILNGDPNATNNIDAQYAIYQRFPDQPMYYANYINALLVTSPADGDPEDAVEAKLHRLLPALQRGKEIEPDNGYYDLLIADMLLYSSTVTIEDAGPTYQMPMRFGRIGTSENDDYRVTNQARFEQGQEAFFRAARSPYIRAYAVEMEQYRQSLLPKATRYADYLYRQARAIEILLRSLGHSRRAVRIMADYAFDQAKAGDLHTADQTLTSIRRIAGLDIKDAHVLIEYFVGEGLFRHALEYEMVIAQQVTNQTEVAEQLWARLEELNKQRTLAMDEPDNLERHLYERAGVVIRAIWPTAATPPVDLHVPREAELAMLDQGVLGFGVALATGVLLIWSLTLGGIYWHRKRRDSSNLPMLLWLNWRQLAVVLGGGVLMPVGVYVIWAWLLPDGSHSYSMNFAVDRLIIEWWLLGIAMVVASTHLGLWAIRRRARAVGMELPNSISQRAWWTLAAFTLPMVVTVVGFFAVWPVSKSVGEVPHWLLAWFVYAPILLLIWPVCWVVWLLMAIKELRWRWRAIGSGMVFLLAASVVIGFGIWMIVPSLDRWNLGWMGILLGVAGTVVFAVLRLFAQRGRQPQFVASAARSLVPIYALGTLLVVVIGGPTLATLEAVRTRQLVQSDVFLWNEVQRSKYSNLRDQLVAEMPPASEIEITHGEPSGRSLSQ